jgi:hypothetical protein
MHLIRPLLPGNILSETACFASCRFLKFLKWHARCEEVACEESLKVKSQAESKCVEDAKQTGAAKSLCIPFEQDPIPSGAVCFCCGKPAKRWALFGRSY